MTVTFFGSRAFLATLLVMIGVGCRRKSAGPPDAPPDQLKPAATLPPPPIAESGSGSLASGSGFTAFAIGEGSVGTFYNFTIQMVGQGCTLWTDAGPWQYGELSPRTASASYRLANGHSLTWKCQTPDQRAFTKIDICGQEYSLSNGGLFLIATRAGDPQIVQIKSPDYKVLELEPLTMQFPEVAQFLSGKRMTPIAK